MEPSGSFQACSGIALPLPLPFSIGGQWQDVEQCFSTAGPRPGTGTWHQFYRVARGSPGICHFSFLIIFFNKCFTVGIF